MRKLKSLLAKNFLFIIVFLILLNFIFISLFIINFINIEKLKESIITLNSTTTTTTTNQFDLLSPSIAQLNVAEFLEIKKTYTVSYSPLKANISLLFSDKNDNFGLYVEDLTTGSWFGINERENFFPASLLKVPILIAVLKKVELGEINLSDIKTLQENDLSYTYGTLYTKGAGYNLTVHDLLKYLVNQSDNTAQRVLRRELSEKDIDEAIIAMGLTAPPTLNSTEIYMLSPKIYSNIFRSLYYSTYLRRPFSQLALTLMSETIFNWQVEAGLPEEIQYSHKIGIWASLGYYHDCGIVYLPQKHYLICMMSKNSTPEESSYFMRKVSEEIYTYMFSTLRN